MPKAMRDSIGDRPEYRKMSKELDLLLKEEVFPVYRRLKKFLETEYLPKAAPLGQNRERYLKYMEAHLGKNHPSPEELSKKGKQLVKKLHKELRAIAKEISPEAKSLHSFMNGFKRRKSNQYKNKEEFLRLAAEEEERSNEFARTVVRVPKYKLKTGIIPEVYADTVPAWYIAGYETGEVQFNLTKLLSSQYKSELKTLWTHEILGHHYAYGHALENDWLSWYRADSAHTVYDEGWALYMEDQRYLHDDDYTPEEKVGYIRNQLWRAARLVVDTGLHTGTMTKAQAMRYFMDATFDNKTLAKSEIERYMDWPGQALAYMYGSWKFWEIRNKVEKTLGKRNFDKIKFHNKLLSVASIPIDELEFVMLKWAKRRKGQLDWHSEARLTTRTKSSPRKSLSKRKSKSRR